MKYSMESLDLAIDALLPNIKKAKEKGIHFNRPQLLEMVAVQFMVSGDYKDFRDFKKVMCYYVVECALKDLHENGYMTFGELELEDEL